LSGQWFIGFVILRYMTCSKWLVNQLHKLCFMRITLISMAFA